MNKVVLLAPTPPPASGIASWTMRMLQCGLGDHWQPIDLLRQLYANASGAVEMGKRGRRYMKEYWGKAHCVESYVNILFYVQRLKPMLRS